MARKYAYTTIPLGRISFDQAFRNRGIDVDHEVRLLKRRARYAQTTESRSHYYWPGTHTLDPYTRRYGNADQISRDLATLRNTRSTSEYIAIWCRLNHLKENAACPTTT